MATCYRKVGGRYYSPSEYKRLKRRHGYTTTYKGKKYHFVKDAPTAAERRRRKKVAKMTYEHERDTHW